MDLLHKFFGDGAHTVAHDRAYVTALEEKYGPVLLLAQQKGLKIESVRLEGEKLVLHGTIASATMRDEVVKEIDLVDPNRSDLALEIRVAR